MRRELGARDGFSLIVDGSLPHTRTHSSLRRDTSTTRRARARDDRRSRRRTASTVGGGGVCARALTKSLASGSSDDVIDGVAGCLLPAARVSYRQAARLHSAPPCHQSPWPVMFRATATQYCVGVVTTWRDAPAWRRRVQRACSRIHGLRAVTTGGGRRRLRLCDAAAKRPPAHCTSTCSRYLAAWVQRICCNIAVWQ